MARWRVEQYGRSPQPAPIAKARFTEPFILISIADVGGGYEQHEQIPDSPHLVETLRLNFHEASPAMRLLWAAGSRKKQGGLQSLHQHRCFSARDATAILNLLTRRLPEVSLVVTLCEAGQERSVRLAAAIAELIEVEPENFQALRRHLRKKNKAAGIDRNWLYHRMLWHAKRKRWKPPE